MIESIRRNLEAYLLLLTVLIAVGGYWLLSLPQRVGVPPALWAYAALFAGLYTGAHFAVRRLAPGADPLFLPVAAMLNAIGFVLIARLQDAPTAAAPAVAQARWLAVSVAAFVALLWFVRDARDLARYRYTWALIGVALLLLPLLPVIGKEVNGARLWIEAGPLNFQPAELAKVLLVLFFASYLAERRELLTVATRRIGPIGIPDTRHFGPLALAWAVSMLIMIFQKDLGSSLLFFAIFVVMLWTATARPIYLIAGTGLFAAGALFTYQAFAHVQSRIEVWREPFALVQSLFALATGGAWGTGLGQGRPDLIPSVQTDFIFSALGEELGLAGTVAVLTAYALFVARAFGLATRCRDDFSKLLVVGLAGAFGLQTVLIIGGVTNLIPLTGITLPFMSYGGSSLLSNFLLVALLVRVSDQVTQQTGEAPPTEVNVPAGGGR
jgi:cell division protein FtsW (lipid II flippase)